MVGGGGVPSQHTHLLSPSLRSLPGLEPPGRAERGGQRPAQLAPERQPSGFCGLGLGGLGSGSTWVAKPSPLFHFGAPRQELDELKEAPRCPPSGSWGPGRGVLGGPPGPASRGACVSRPSPAARLRPASPHRGLCPPAARRPLPVPAGSAPPPPRWPHFLGAGGRSGTGTKGLSRGSSQRGGIRSRAERGAKAVLAKKMSA